MQTLAKIFVISGPSGTGKSTLLKRLFADYPENFGFTVSHTTRSMRPGEVNGKDYYFVEKDVMIKEVAEGKFVESATFAGNMYGTSIMAIEHVLETGKTVILDIDMQGVKAMKQTAFKPRYIFIKPPSLEVLEQRLRGRGTETEEKVQARLSACKQELEYAATPGAYDHIIVNDSLEEAYKKLKEAIFVQP
ncbi:guanylate kinase [Radiomyces spectabilis]|uniref:guanylate kinase n=1 Tax=Radiomyces spectabilis TaxID=64574 RepID=UPI00221F5111|nr:guanylate kinase [Radiomyces spectabilis]KAI8366055.1 guanylate kinase [Radiomyces spectabilis]